MQQPMNDLIWEEETVSPIHAGRRPAMPEGGALEDLLPWQRFLLATFLFLDVTVVGFLFLVILGRFQLP